MPLTRGQLESVLVRRCGAKLTYAGLDGLTYDGTNADLNDPIVQGLFSLGLAVVNIANVSDDDLAAVSGDQVPQLLDVAELRALESVLGNRAEPDVSEVNTKISDGRFYNGLERTVARKRQQVERQYGIGVAVVTAGVLDLGISATIDPATGVPH